MSDAVRKFTLKLRDAWEACATNMQHLMWGEATTCGTTAAEHRFMSGKATWTAFLSARVFGVCFEWSSHNQMVAPSTSVCWFSSENSKQSKSSFNHRMNISVSWPTFFPNLMSTLDFTRLQMLSVFSPTPISVMYKMKDKGQHSPFSANNPSFLQICFRSNWANDPKISVSMQMATSRITDLRCQNVTFCFPSSEFLPFSYWIKSDPHNCRDCKVSKLRRCVPFQFISRS